MESDPRHDVLVADLRALGRSLPIDGDLEGTSLTAAVMARLADAPALPPISRWQQLRQRAAAGIARRRRRILILAAVLLLGGLGVPGVRAAVVEWFTFGGVNVRIEPTPGPSVTKAPPPPTATGTLSLEQARRQVDFSPLMLTALGPPQAVEVSADRRVLSLTWNGPDGATIRLDQFSGRLDYVFAKTSPEVEWTSVAGEAGLWFDQPHEVVVLEPDGTRRTETARLAGQTLIWERGETVVLRLEGDFTRERALEIAESAQPLP